MKPDRNVSRPHGRSTSAPAGQPTHPPHHLAGTGLASARARFDLRAEAARRRPRLLAGLAVGLLLVLGLVAWLGWFSTVLPATTVEVRGVAATTVARVRGVAAVPLGGPLLRVDTGAVGERLVAAREWTQISVSRSLPGTVVIELKPRTAVLVVRNSQGQLEVVDGDGYAFSTVTAAPTGVPLVTSGSGRMTASGVAAAFSVMQSLEPGLRSSVSNLAVSASDQVTFSLQTTGRSKAVVWGGAAQGATKARLTKILMGQPGSVIDVSDPDSPVTR